VKLLVNKRKATAVVTPTWDRRNRRRSPRRMEAGKYKPIMVYGESLIKFSHITSDRPADAS
jgi:hypothetical protein